MKALKEKNDRVQSTPKGLSVEQRSINGELRGLSWEGQKSFFHL